MGAKISLIGPSGCGKTTLAEALSSIYGLKALDLDRIVEIRKGLTVGNIFSSFGEEYFRNLEKKCLEETLENDFDILSTGGGTPCFFDNLEKLNSKSVTVYLECPEERLAERLEKYGKDRPLVKDKSSTQLLEYCRGSLAERIKFYSSAHYVFDASKLDTLEEILTSAENFYNLFLKPHFNRCS